MACPQPFEVPNPYFNSPRFLSLRDRYTKPYIEVPCGWCLNCRIDKRNFLEDCCNFLQKKYGYCAFVTYTYDDNWLVERCNSVKVPVTVSSFEKINWLHKVKVFTQRLLNTHQTEFSLNRDDARLLNYRVRSRIRNMKNTPMTNHDYKILYVGEYGDKFGRPHLHYLYFGIDYTQPVFQDCWKYGMVESLPVKNGAFRYVIDYLDKQVHGELAKELFDDCGLTRPFMAHSVGFATDFVLSRLDEIRSHNGNYYTENWKLRPLPLYWKNKFQVKVDSHLNTQRLIAEYNSKYGTNFKGRSLAFDMFRKKHILDSFNHSRNMARRRQIPVSDLYFETFSHAPLDDLVHSALGHTKIENEWIPF